MKKLLIVVLTSTLLISGCSNSTQNTSESDNEQSKEVVSENWLDTKSDAIEAEGKAAFESLVPDYDEFEDTGYYSGPKNELPEHSTKLTNGYSITFDTSLVSASAVESDDFLFHPMFVVSYIGKKWAFIESIYLKIGEDPKEFKLAMKPIRNVLSPLVGEIAVIYISDEDINFLSKMFNYNEVQIRYYDTENVIDDINLSILELKLLKKILIAYRYMYQNNLLTTRPIVK